MLKQDKKYIFFLCLCLGILVVLQLLTPTPTDWKLSYLKKDKIPYGTSAIYQALPLLFRNKPIIKEVPVYNAVKEEIVKKSNYIIINHSFEPDKLDVQELLNFVKKGNDVFIAANYFSETFCDSLKIMTEVFYNSPLQLSKDSITGKRNFELEKNQKMNLCNGSLKAPKPYNIVSMTNAYFSEWDTLNTIILGELADKKVNFIKIKLNEGNLYLHVTPEVFVNYNFLNDKNAEYASKVFSYLTGDRVIWDEYYKIGKIRNENSLTVILSHPALAMTYYVLIVSALLFILFGIKRKQRIIPIIEPVRNTTLEFVDAISRLYYQQVSHRQLAEKQIAYFLASIRSVFRITTAEYDDLFIRKLSDRSAVPYEQVKGLFKYIDYIKAKGNLHEQELLVLNTMIEEFNRLNKR